MKLGGSTRDRDEDVPVVLVDEGGVPPTITTAEVDLGRPRRPIREIVLGLVAVVVVVGVGLLGSGGDDEGEESMPETSTTTERRAATSPRRSPSTTRPRPSTTTTSTTLFSRTAGTGPILPGDPTGTVLAYVDSTGTAVMLDLDSGDRCRVDLHARDGAWSPWSSQVRMATMFVTTNQGIVEIDPSCTVTAHDNLFAGGWPAIVVGESVWLADHEGAVIAEANLRTGERSGRSIELPMYGGAAFQAVDDGIVVGIQGEMTLVELATDRRTSLGTGTPVAGTGHHVVYVSCPALECGVGVLDVASGERRPVGAVQAVPWEPSAASNDGRLVRISEQQDGPSGAIRSVVVDVTSATVVFETDLTMTTFTSDSEWLIGLRGAELVAVRLDDSLEVPLDVEGHAVHALAVLTIP